MWKRGARDSIEEPSESSQKPDAQRFLPSAPEEPIDNRLAGDTRGLHFNSYNQEWAGFVPYRGPCPKIDIFGKVGLHCYNLLKGILTIFVSTQVLHKDYLNSYSLHNFGGNGSSTQFQLLSSKHRRGGRRGDYSEWNKDAVDGFFKGHMPYWMPEDALTGTDKLQYYEMKESEVEEEKEWLHLYVELALFSKCQSNLEAMESAKPFEMRKIVVRTREDVESKKKVKAENAILYICFKTRCSQNCNGIIRKNNGYKALPFFA